jgi:hypothetical protein
MECSKEKLKIFGLEHYTYINQIFGDISVREIITEVFPSSPKYKFKALVGEGAFEGSYHHVLKYGKKTVCSVEAGHQNIDVDVNDTLCQSYSLLSYFNIEIPTNKKDKQIAMVKMYRNMLSNPKFILALDDVIHSGNSSLWIDYTIPGDSTNLRMVKADILNSVRKVLKDWESFGYYYFIGEGKCPSGKGRAQRKSKRCIRKNPNRSCKKKRGVSTMNYK